MRVITFSKVIYDGYPSVDLFLFLIKQKYSRIFAFFDIIPDLFLYAFGRISTVQLYSHFYSIVLDNITVSELMHFKVNNIHKVDLEGFGLKPNCKDDLIISLEPSFIVDFFINRTEYQVLCTEFDVRTRKVLREDWLTSNRLNVIKHIGVSYINQLFIYSFKETDIMNISEYTFIYRDHQLIELRKYESNIFDRIMYNILNRKIITFYAFAFLIGIITSFIALGLTSFGNPILAWAYSFIIWMILTYLMATRIINEKRFTSKYIVPFLISITPCFLFQLFWVLLFQVLLGFYTVVNIPIAGILSYFLLIFFVKFYPFD
ncbi:MAG: hypothetical protein LBT75_04200 [Bacilli bacterium]|jgi:hypothetical protein|nr:hypothetical protein [Bacilli bacterium]